LFGWQVYGTLCGSSGREIISGQDRQYEQTP
jgi:hypothetical protein